MKKLLLFLSIWAVLGLTTKSCISAVVEEKKEVDPDPDEPDPGEEVYSTFYVFFNTNLLENAKTYASPNLSATNSSITWGSSEYVGVFMMGDGNNLIYNNRRYYINADNNAMGRRSALLSDTITTAYRNASCYGYYPYQSTTSGTIVSYKLDSVQNQSADKSISTKMDDVLTPNIFMIAPTSQPFAFINGTGVMEYSAIFSFLGFQVTKAPGYTSLFGQRVQKMQIYIANKNDLSKPLNYNLAGDYTIDISRSIGMTNYQGPTFTSGNNRITASVTGGEFITEFVLTSPYVWFVVNPVTIQSNECLVAVVETASSRIISSYDIAALKANNTYRMPVVATQSNTITDQPVTVFLKEEASNCYVIPRSGICQIPLFTTNGTALRGDTVVWLWASKENGGANFDIKELIDPTSIIYNENDILDNSSFIHFRVGTNFGVYSKGNVILALKNKNGDIVWTWHIWITDELEEMVHDGGFEFLDRNIGALTAQAGHSPIDNFGFVYQWGRKDPFFGGDGNNNETTANALSIARANTIVNTSVSGVWPTPSSTQRTADFAKQNPMTFICNNTTPTPEIGLADWLAGSSATNRWSEDHKTDNDPCPYGYRVPGKAELRTLHTAAAENNSALYFRNGGHWHWDYYYYWRGGITTVWPTAGMRQGRFAYQGNTGAQLLNSGTAEARGQCYYWTSTPLSAGGTVIPGGSFRVHTAGTLLYSEDEYGDNADAYPIRCIKE